LYRGIFYVVNVYGAICLQIKKILDANSFLKSGNDEPFKCEVFMTKGRDILFLTLLKRLIEPPMQTNNVEILRSSITLIS
jgi:hypothetical protein